MEQVKVGPVVYQVKTIKNLKDRRDGVTLWGQANHEAFEIRLSTRHTLESRFVTTWHEVIHCFEPVYGIDLGEEYVNLLATAISQILQDNPYLNWTEYVKANGRSPDNEANQPIPPGPG